MKKGETPETVEAFEALWKAECEEWQAIRKEITRGRDNGHGDRMPRITTAARVTEVQRRRMRARGEISVLDSVFARRLITRAVSPLHRDPSPR